MRYLNRRLIPAGIALTTLVCAVALRGPLLRVGGMALEAAAICFFAAPLATLLERWLSRPAAALAALAAIGVAAGALLFLLLPGMLGEALELARTLPRSIRALSGWIENARMWVEARLPGVALPALDWKGLEGVLSNVAGGMAGFAVRLADAVGNLSMAAVLAWFFLVDRDRLLLRLELMLPQACRHAAIRMGNDVCRSLRLYLGGQLVIAAAVGALSVAALLVIGVRSALALGLLIGVMNMIPYFGPFIGGAPAVLIALTDGWQKAALTLGALIVIQQLDGSWLSPRVIGSVTGFSPALVLVGLYAGASVGGVAGMVLTLPAMLVIRTLFRVFVQKCENI